MDYNRKYKCKYCDYKGNREQLVNHVESKHSDLVSDEYPASRLVYNYLNNVECGKCIICGKPTKWNDKTWKYYRHCGSKECKEKIKDTYRKNAISAKGKYNFTNDPKHLEKMLANRKISGVYTCSNGAKKTYTGSYERKTIEFLDKVLNVDPDDVLMPGPIFEYEYNGEMHKWITDIYYIPYNLVIEVKDGGDNPNNRNMPEYRAKQLAKEKAIIESGVYNYLRLTNNNFVQLIDMFTTLRLSMINDTNDTRKAIIKINEDVALDATYKVSPDLALLFIYDEYCTNISKICLTEMSSIYYIEPDENNILVEKCKNELPENSLTYLINNNDPSFINEVANHFKNNIPISDKYGLFEMACKRKFISLPQLVIENNLTLLDADDYTYSNLTKNAIDHINDMYCLESSYIEDIDDYTRDLLKKYDVKLNSCRSGYFLETNNMEPALATKPTSSLYDTISKINTFGLLIRKYGG